LSNNTALKHLTCFKNKFDCESFEDTED